MTNYEYLKDHIDSVDSVAQILCVMLQEAAPEDKWCCEGCPFQSVCDEDRDGIKEWLERKKDYRLKGGKP